ncbi:YfcE family phosphodiesterase [Priestia megaterium]|nr:YfcE family phosphodiesterase [Priestia megaterium]
MKIVIVSDTHIPKRAKKLPDRLIKELHESDLILHAGDWQTVDAYRLFTKYCEAKGVIGNGDEPALKTYCPMRLLLTIRGFHIGLIHGHGTKKTTEKRVIEAFTEDEVTAIIFGHSHIPLHKTVNGIELFNPGSATDKRRQNQYSFGLLSIEDALSFEHIFYDSKE